MTNQLQLTCKIERAAGGCEFSAVTLLPAEMAQLDGKSIKIDGETIRFKMWNGTRLYVNQRRWTLGFFSLVDWHLTWGTPSVAQLQGDRPSPVVAQAVCELLGIKNGHRVLEVA
jgi:hypothetical protein